MKASEILGHSGEWASITREEAVRRCFGRPSPRISRPNPSPVNALEEPTKQAVKIKITKLDCQSFAPLVDTVLIHYETSTCWTSNSTADTRAA